MKYKIGNFIFGIPRNSGVVLVGDKKSFSCDEVKNVQHLIYRPTEFLGRQRKSSVSGGDVFTATVSIGEYKKAAFDTYLHMNVERKLRDSNLTLNDLPVQEDFYVFEFSINQYLYIARDSNFKTLLDNPVTFYCVKWSFDRSQLSCGTYGPWNESISMGISNIITSTFPKYEWKEMYYDSQNFLNQLVVSKL